jgi:hypothetical protein
MLRDHIIDCQIYNLSPKEQRELESFVEENLHTIQLNSPIQVPLYVCLCLCQEEK